MRDLSHDELSKQHIRYMVGGRSPLAAGERLFRFEFPERPGALMKFLSAMAPNWNISLFHYRNQGVDFSSAWSASRRRRRMRRRWTPSWRNWATPIPKTDNPAYRQFLAKGRTAMAWRSGSRGEKGR